MQRFSLGSAPTFLLALIAVGTLLTGAGSAKYGTSSRLLATSRAPSVTAPTATSPINSASSISGCTSITDASLREQGPDMRLYSDSDRTPGVPIYAGAEFDSEYCLRACPSTCQNSYLVSGLLQSEIEAFYREVLPTRGWVYVGQTGPKQNLLYQNYHYVWKNPSNTGPDRVYLAMGFYEGSRTTRIDMGVYAWPDPKKPPLHPQASQPEVKWAEDPEFGSPERKVSYTTDASSSVVMDYYKNTLVQKGWCLNLEASSDSELHFFAGAGDLLGGGGGVVSIMSAGVDSGSAEGSDRTRIQIVTTGTEFTPEDMQEQK